MKEYAVLVDIARKRDFTGIMVMKDCPEIVEGNRAIESPDRIVHTFEVKHIAKFNGLRYEEIADSVEKVMNHADLKNNADLLVDGTGVGDAVIEMIRDRGLYPLPIIFTSTGQAREVYAEVGKVFSDAPGQLKGARTIEAYHVPKVDLVSAGQVLLQQKRLRVAPSRWGEDFRKQLESFKGKVNEKGNRTFEADTESVHDDLVVCYLMGAWWFQNRKEKDAIPERDLEPSTSMVKWDPLDFM